jgi:hypothetical protein
MGRGLKDPVENFWSKVDQTGDCWTWTAGRDKDGYGKFAIGLGGHAQRHVRAHRFAYESLVGDIPDGHVVMHRCDNPPCVRPDHLTTGTPLDNNDDKIAKGRDVRVWGTPLRRSRQTHCKQGHPFDEENTQVMATGHRRCRECGRAAARRYYHRKAAR